MIKKFFKFSLFAILGIAMPGMLEAVAVSPALLEQETRQAAQTLYGLIAFIFIIGIVIGAWIQKKLNHTIK